MVVSVQSRRKISGRIAILGCLCALGIQTSLQSSALEPINEFEFITIFPPTNIWNTSIESLPVHHQSFQYVNSIGAQKAVHADFGSGLWQGKPMGFPINIADKSTPRKRFRFQYADESDNAPYPVPATAQIEGGEQSTGDRHLIVIEKDQQKLYEIFDAVRSDTDQWKGGAGAIFDLRTNALRHDGWTSADAAGLPIFPGLVRYDEVAAGHIDHALRFTAPSTRQSYLWPARHFASKSKDPALPPMGARFRLKQNFDVSGFSRDCQTILQCLKKYGMILADNGSSWFISGESHSKWNNDSLQQLSRLHGADFECIDESALMVEPDSGQAH